MPASSSDARRQQCPIAGLKRASVALAAAGALFTALPQFSRATDEHEVNVLPLGAGAFRIHAHALVRAPRETVWSTVTDYDHFASFVPGLHTSHLTFREGAFCIVQQQWRVSLLWIPIPIQITVLSIERPPSVVEVHLISGNLKRLDGNYTINTASDGRVALDWEGSIEDATIVPDWVSSSIVDKQAQAQFRGMIAEIERRARALERAP